jgi:hypothetical protein
VNNELLVGGVFCDLVEVFVLIMVSYYLNWIFLESLERFMHFFSLIWMTGILELLYVVTVITVKSFKVAQSWISSFTRLCFGALLFLLYINDLQYRQKMLFIICVTSRQCTLIW